MNNDFKTKNAVSGNSLKKIKPASCQCKMIIFRTPHKHQKLVKCKNMAFI